MEFRILGPVEVYDRGRRLELGAQKHRALLGVLLEHANEVIPTERLIDELWGGRPPATASKLVQGYVSGLRRSLGAGAILTRDSGYALDLADGRLDALEFERLVEEARTLPAEQAAQKLREALALWRGSSAVERLNEQRLEALSARIDADLACGRHRRLVAELEALVKEHPYREGLRAQLMLALYRSGRQADALEAFRDARRVLDEDLGIEPGDELQALEKAILNQDPALGAPAASAPRPAASLPVPATPLVGRRRELERAGALLRHHRLLTLTGPGGSGKTRMALELASDALGDFADGVYWVPLQAVRDVELVLPAIEQAVGARGELAGHLRDKHLLLVLDNLEHLLPAASKLADILGAAPELKLLVTSRERLHVRAEQEYPVGPLKEEDAIELFAERARAVRPDFVDDPAVAVLCRRLDCLPLALELAAARVKTVEPTELLQRFEQRLPLLTGGPADAPARHRTMRATIAWSYDALEPGLDQLFARLAVFVGGCTVEAAEHVCDADLDGLQALVEKNLLVREGGRLHMLEAIREFALEQLEAAGEAAELRRRHADFYLARAERLDPDVRPLPLHVRRARFAVERANSLAALEHFRREQDHASEARLAAASLWIDWAWNPEEGSRWLGRVATYDDLPTPVRARVVWAASRIARNRGDHALDAELSEELVDLWRSLDDKQLTVRTLARLAIVSTQLGDADRARAALAEAQSIARELGTDNALAIADMAEATVALHSDRLSEAQAACERALDGFRRADAPVGIMGILTYLGWIGLAQQRHDQAARSFREGLITRRGADVLWTADGDLEGLAGVATARGEPSVAAVLLGAAEAARRAAGARDEPLQADLRARTLAAIRESLDDDAFEAALADGRAMTIDAAVEYALASVD